MPWAAALVTGVWVQHVTWRDVTWLTPFGVFEYITFSHSPSSFMKGFFSQGPLWRSEVQHTHGHVHCIHLLQSTMQRGQCRNDVNNNTDAGLQQLSCNSVFPSTIDRLQEADKTISTAHRQDDTALVIRTLQWNSTTAWQPVCSHVTFIFPPISIQGWVKIDLHMPTVHHIIKAFITQAQRNSD